MEDKKPTQPIIAPDAPKKRGRRDVHDRVESEKEKFARMQAELEQQRAKIAAAEEAAGARVGRLSIKAGLAELRVDDETLLKALEELAERFRNSQK